MAATTALPVYPVLVIGSANSGSDVLVTKIRNMGPRMQVKLYTELPADSVDPKLTFAAVWIVADAVASAEETENTVELIRSLKKNAPMNGLTEDTLWIVVATDAVIAADFAAAKAAANAAAVAARNEKKADKLFSLLNDELKWVPEKNRFDHPISLLTGFHIGELIDIQLPEPYVFFTDLFADPPCNPAYNNMTLDDIREEALREIERAKKHGSVEVVKCKHENRQVSIQFSRKSAN